MAIEFIGVGAQKSGTSWVYACLYEHPEICAPIKELHFFSRPRYAKGQEWYEHHFRNCEASKITGEFSTSYLVSPEAPERMHQLYPDAKLIAILRNPTERAYSNYRNAIKAGEIAKDVSFATFLATEPTAIAQGKYHEQLERYYNYFSKDRVLVLIYEDSLKDPAAFIKQIYTFLGVDADFAPSMLHREINIGRTPKAVGVDTVMHRVAETLRTIGADKVVWLVKKSGLTDVIRRVNTESPKEAKPDLGNMNHYFRADAEKLRDLLGRDMVQEWNL